MAHLNPLLNEMTALFTEAANKVITLEAARDEIRDSLCSIDNRDFHKTPLQGTDVLLLSAHMLSENENLFYVRYKCRNCKVYNDDPTWSAVLNDSLIIYCSKDAWRRSIRKMGNIRYRTTSDWFTATLQCKTNRQCQNCDHNVSRIVKCTRLPTFMRFHVDNVNVHWEHTFKLQNCTYRLVGILYRDDAHFTCISVLKSGDMYFNDGITTGRTCKLLGNIHNVSERSLTKDPLNNRCLFTIYVKVE